MKTAGEGAAGRPQRLWITLSEVVGVLALVIAGLNFWDSHHQRAEDARRQAAVDQAAGRAHTAIVFTAEPRGEGASLSLDPANPAQVVQSQRYLFPHAVLAHAMEVDAAKPQIDLAWIAGGLKAGLESRRASSAGEATTPVGLFTTYVEDGETRTDGSLYRLGYSWRPRLFGGPVIRLEGLSLVRRGVGPGLRAAVEADARGGQSGS